MFRQDKIQITITFRLCQQADLPNLEWFGEYADHRDIFRQTFERQEKGEIIMLVAEANHFPVGQIWIDLTKEGQNGIGILWALRVLPPLQNLGIGSRLIAIAEELLKNKDFLIAEIGVEKDNGDAKRLYERLGYQVVGDNVEEWDYTTPGGEVKHEMIEEWIMHKRLV
jgi:ribosomal protein S18 acetylase RimI-like enzyme